MAADREPESSVAVEVRGLSIYTHHGVTAAEQELGQRLELDIRLELAGCEAVRSDRLEDTVDYAEVCALASAAALERSCRTLERVAQLVAERLRERFGCRAVRVRIAKPEPPLEARVDDVAVTVRLA